MTRNATSSFDGFDPDVLDAARDVARRAGMPLEAWIAANVPQGGSKNLRRRRQSGPKDGNTLSLRAESYREVPPNARGGSERAPETLDALMRRLDGIDRTLAGERRGEETVADRLMQTIEERIDQALRTGSAPTRQVADRLGEIERQMLNLGEQVAARPPGRRGRPAAEEIRSAVQEIRQRQRDLAGDPAAEQGPAEARDAFVQALPAPSRHVPADDAPGPTGTVAAMHQDIARRLANMDLRAEDDTSAVVSELRQETARLRESIDNLATGRDVGALEQAVIALASGVERVNASTDLSPIAAPVELIRAQVERLADEVAETVHARVTSEVERLAARLDSVAAATPSDVSDRDAVAAVFRELEEIRRLVAALAGPERIQSLAQGLQAISAQVAELQTTAGEGDPSLRPLLEEIRNGLAVPAPAALARQIEAMAAKVDVLHDRASRPHEAGEIDSQAILGRIDALADKVDQAGAHPVGDLDARLNQPALPEADIAGINAMLRSLAEKVDRVGDRESGGNLDALERQVVNLAQRMDERFESRGQDPALAGLERTMGDLLAQVTALRASGPDEATLERAARTAVAAARDETAPSELSVLRAGLADLQTRQSASDQRLSTTLDGFQSVLERLAARVEGAPLPGAAQATLAAQLLSTTGAARPAGGHRPEAERDAAETDRPGEELLEPGSARPRTEPPATPRAHPLRARLDEERAAGAATPEPAGDLKTSFIAAARRAAQAAQAELESESALSADRREGRSRMAAPAAAAGEGRLAALRAEIDRRRRPLLLGLAATVLVLGALAAGIASFSEDETPAQPPRVAAPALPSTAAPPAQAAASPDAAREAPKEGAQEGLAPAAKPALADPQTTQAIPASPPTPAEARPAPRARAAVPTVPGMGSLGTDLAALPPALAKLKQEALDGSGPGVWELATRVAEGRGAPRDLTLATKLFEKLAGAGYAPAQYKLAGHYEKGLGVTRDLGQAKLWYGRAAEQGHVRSMHNLAVLYAENPGPSGKPDYASAASWFRQGAENGVRDSQYNLAVLHARGLGLTQDLVQSYAWFAAAAAQGDDDAAKKRDDVATKLSPADLASAKDIAAAFKPRKLDAAVNEPPAPREGGGAAMTLLGAPTPSPATFAHSRKGG